MKISWHDVFEDLEPPPGGLEVLQSRLAEAPALEFQSRRRTRRARWVVAAVATCVFIWILIPSTSQNRRGATENRLEPAVMAEGNPALFRFGLVAPSAEAVTVPPDLRHQIAVQKVELGTPNVIYYRVAVLPTSRSRLNSR